MYAVRDADRLGVAVYNYVPTLQKAGQRIAETLVEHFETEKVD